MLTRRCSPIKGRGAGRGTCPSRTPVQFAEPGWEATDSQVLLVQSSGPGVTCSAGPSFPNPHPAALATSNFPPMGLGWLHTPPVYPHTHCPGQSEMDWLLGVAFVATGRSEEAAVARKERACLDLGLILGWDPLRETLGRSGGAGLQFECAGESPGDLVQTKIQVGSWTGS